MKIIYLFIFAVVSCKAVVNNGFTKVEDRRADHIIEIRFANVPTTYFTVISAIQKTAFNTQIQYYPANSAYPSVVMLSFTCFNMSKEEMTRLKKRIGSCSGVIAVEDAQ